MRRFMVLFAALGFAAATTALVVPGAGAQETGSAPVTIKKVALNAPVGTQFTIQLTCDNSAIIPPGGTPADSVDTLDFAFTANAAGEAVPDGPNTVGFDNEAICTVTETAAGGAATTSYECADNFASVRSTADSLGPEDPAVDPQAPAIDPTGFCTTFGPQTEPIVFDVLAVQQEVTVTVTNSFPIEVQPSFTG